ncbi:hypothetical protein [Mycobacterium sp. 1245852.3]|uniref:hypothetical protein n=1 Tax=Mycobacterium sp. 1245852.3 TaxID=1856860 RepID=UPI0012EA5E9F|nr:hypothetical protein [Mycobacterium sp. 1245852.3]
MASHNPDFWEQLKALVTNQLGTCNSCRRPYVDGTPHPNDWQINVFLGIPFTLKCPDCQTPEERANMAIEQAIGPKYKREGIRFVPVDPEQDGTGPKPASE